MAAAPSPDGGRTRDADPGVRQDGGTAPSAEGATLIGYVFVLGVGYVMGTKAGRRRYEQIVGTYHAMTSSPIAKSVIDKGRRSIANRIHPEPTMVPLAELEDGTVVLEPQEPEA